MAMNMRISPKFENGTIGCKKNNLISAMNFVQKSNCAVIQPVMIFLFSLKSQQRMRQKNCSKVPSDAWNIRT